MTCAEELWCTYQQGLDHLQVIKSIVEVQITYLASNWQRLPFFSIHLVFTIESSELKNFWEISQKTTFPFAIDLYYLCKYMIRPLVSRHASLPPRLLSSFCLFEHRN